MNEQIKCKAFHLTPGSKTAPFIFLKDASNLAIVDCVTFVQPAFCLPVCKGLNTDDLRQRTLKFFGPGSEYDTPVNNPYREKGGWKTSFLVAKERTNLLGLYKKGKLRMYLLQVRVLNCPSRDHGDTEAWRASWRMLMQAKRRLVNLQNIPSID